MVIKNVILTIKLFGIAKVKGTELKMSPLEKRLVNLKELLAQEQGNTLYAQDLKLSIKQCEVELKTVVSKKGYRMVEV